jgi:ribosomal protein S18 acetylase RimI-like enzyme
MIIRPANERDYDRITEIDVIAFSDSDYGRATGLYGNPDGQRARRNNARRMCERGRTIVAISGLDIVGFVTVEADVICNLAVLPAFRGLGIGTLLANRAVAIGAQRVFTAHEPSAVRVYEKAGFTKVTPKHHGYLMERGRVDRCQK